MIAGRTYPRDDTTYVILAGGSSSRMGRDKALLPMQGEPLISLVLDRGKTITDHILVITNRPDDYNFLKVPLAADVIDCKGPLVGLYTALYSLKSKFIILVGCDMPFINPSLLTFQLNILEQEDFDIVIPRHDDILEPLHAVYRRETCLDPVRVELDDGKRSLIGWHNRVRVQEISGSTLLFFDPDRRAFVNLNSPQDFEEIEEFSSH